MAIRRIFPGLRRNRRLDLAIFGLIVAGALLLLRFLPEPEISHVSGRAHVIDGDSIVVSGVAIRLKGMDAPEAGQTCGAEGANWPCGSEASRRLAERLRGQTVECSGSGYDVHGRLLARCRAGDTDVNAWMVEQGLAVSYDDYPAEERAARKAGRGLWSGPFERPRDWRDRHGS
ncbi:MAG: thermonuclease family protein [Hyphomicrobiales bacterium]